jgi:IS6 family transposase
MPTSCLFKWRHFAPEIISLWGAMVDSTGATLDFMLSPARDADAAQRFSRKVPGAGHTATPRVITVDQNPARPSAFEALQQERPLPETCPLRRCKVFQ